MKNKLILLSLLCAPQAFAAATSSTITISHPWARGGMSGMAAGYFTATNNGPTEDTLLSAKVEGAQETMLHQTTVENNIAHMSEAENGIPINPGQTVTFQPGGYHLMLMGLTHPLPSGKKVSGTLTFKNAGNIPVEFEINATSPAEHSHH